MNYYELHISAENKEQADTILNSLLEKKLVTGGLIVNAPARFWWKGKIQDMDYYDISVFTIEEHKQTIIKDIKKTSIEEIPMIRFIEFEGNRELLEWISETLK